KNENDGNAMRSEQIELLHDADPGRNEKQRQIGKQTPARALDTISLQRPPSQTGETIACQQRQQQKYQPDDRARHRKADAAHDDFADELTEQNQAEARGHWPCVRAEKYALIKWCRAGACQSLQHVFLISLP